MTPKRQDKDDHSINALEYGIDSSDYTIGDISTEAKSREIEFSKIIKRSCALFLSATAPITLYERVKLRSIATGSFYRVIFFIFSQQSSTFSVGTVALVLSFILIL